MFPALAQRRADDVTAIEDGANSLVRWTVLFAVPVAAWMAVLSGPLVAVLLGPQWSQAAAVLTALAVSEIFAVAIFPIGDAFKAAGRQRPYVVIQIAALVALVVMMVLAAPAGIAAVAWARTAQLAAFAIAIILLARRVLGFHPAATLRAVGPGAAAGIGVFAGSGAVALLWSSDSLGPLIAGTLAGALAGALTLRVLAPSSWRELRGLAARLARRGGRVSPSAAA